MGIYLTEYRDSRQQKWAGAEIEAGSIEEAQSIANSVASIERSMPDRKFDQLIVLGEKVYEESFEAEQVHAVTSMICSKCDRAWVAVYLGNIEFVDCPSCEARNQI